MIAAYRQVLIEAGGEVPDRNVERLLRRTHVPVPADSLLRIDLLAPGLNVASGLPLFCDVTILSPLTHGGSARPGTSNVGGFLLARAQCDNDATFAMPHGYLRERLCDVHVLRSTHQATIPCILPIARWEPDRSFGFLLI